MKEEMEETGRKMPKPGEHWKHFKGHNVEIITIATHTETKEVEVVYICGGQCWVRPLDNFMSEVDHNKYPDEKHKYRFEKDVLTNYLTASEKFAINKDYWNKEGGIWND